LILLLISVSFLDNFRKRYTETSGIFIFTFLLFFYLVFLRSFHPAVTAIAVAERRSSTARMPVGFSSAVFTGITLFADTENFIARTSVSF